MDISDSLWELATDSTLRISLIAAELATKKARRPGHRQKNLGELAAKLYLVHVNLEPPNPNKQKFLLGRGGVEELLEKLEQMCTVFNQSSFAGQTRVATST